MPSQTIILQIISHLMLYSISLLYNSFYPSEITLTIKALNSAASGFYRQCPVNIKIFYISNNYARIQANLSAANGIDFKLLDRLIVYHQENKNPPYLHLAVKVWGFWRAKLSTAQQATFRACFLIYLHKFQPESHDQG